MIMLDLDDIHPRPLPHLMRHRIARFPFFVADDGGLDDDARIGTGAPPLTQSTRINHQYTFDDLHISLAIFQTSPSDRELDIPSRIPAGYSGKPRCQVER